eukprot:ANDGO_06853.mRNA.1 hypothetical protein
MSSPTGFRRGQFLLIDSLAKYMTGDNPLWSFEAHGKCEHGHECVCSPSVIELNPSANATEMPMTSYIEIQMTSCNSPLDVKCKACSKLVCWDVNSIKYPKCPSYVIVSFGQGAFAPRGTPQSNGTIPFIRDCEYSVSIGTARLLYKLVAMVLNKDESHFCPAFVRPSCTVDPAWCPTSAEWIFYDGTDPKGNTLGYTLTSNLLEAYGNRRTASNLDIGLLMYARQDMFDPAFDPAFQMPSVNGESISPTVISIAQSKLDLRRQRLRKRVASAEGAASQVSKRGKEDVSTSSSRPWKECIEVD